MLEGKLADAQRGAVPAPVADGSPVAAAGERRSAKLPMMIILHGEDSSPGRVGQLLVNAGYSLDIRKPRFGCDLPKSLSGHAGLVIFGGPMSANDPDDYIKRETDFIGVALKEQVPFLGVCLGAQMLARHLGAKVDFHPERHVEIGYHEIRPTAAGASLGRWPDRFYHWHKEGFELAAGTMLLATGDSFENQAYSYGPAAAGVQFHPEITYALVNRWTTDTDYMAKYRDPQSRHAQLNGHLLHSRSVTAWLTEFLDRWAAGRLPARETAKEEANVPA